APRPAANASNAGAAHGPKPPNQPRRTFVANALAEFWGDYSRVRAISSDGVSWEEAHQQRQIEATAATREANLAKQRGFYVDRDDDETVTSPTNIEAGTTADDLQAAAKVIEMLLIQDHSRMKFDAVTPYDSTHRQQVRLLPVSHPEDWAAVSGEPDPEAEHDNRPPGQ
ncbi:AbiV family abortive infection protein, partial [Streptomyces sp. NRRL F-2664]|uniref:AbiV family abortive infection protein n=1 Tax=Streptomyces sp. NRRL F-2664 TaxID=1463842 RepID=UPI00131AD503